MKAARLHDPRDLRVEEVDRETLTPDGVRVEVEYTGICGSDLHEYVSGPIAARAEDWNHEIPESMVEAYLPKFIGHETVGTVVETGEHVSDVDEGERVAVNLLRACEECRYCADGDYHLCTSVDKATMTARGLGEYVVAPDYGIIPVPDSVSFREAALVEPLSVAVHGVRRSEMSVGDSVAIVGAGPIGLGVVQVARAAGARSMVVSEPREARRQAAAEMGADVVVNPAEEDAIDRVTDETDGGADVVFEAAGVGSALTDAIRSTKYGGTTVVMSYFEEEASIHPNDIMETERELVGALGYEGGPRARYGEFPATMRMIEDGRLDPEPLITDVIDLDDVVGQGFERLLDPESDQIKILVRP